MRQQLALFSGAPLEWWWNPLGVLAGRVVGSRSWDRSQFPGWGEAEDLEAALRAILSTTSEDVSEKLVFSHVPSELSVEWCPWLEYRGAVVARDQLPSGHSTERLVLRTETFEVFSGGSRVGECLILPRGNLGFAENGVAQFASILSHLIWLANQTLGSFHEGYSFAVRIGAEGQIRYALYSPQLDPLGSLRSSMQGIEGVALPLSWPHEETARRLRSVL